MSQAIGTTSEREAARSSGERGRALLWSGALATVGACGVPLVAGLTGGWSTPRVAMYAGLALIFLLLSQLPRVPLALACRLLEHPPMLVTLMSGVAFGLQLISGDPFLQPIAFVVVFVFLALSGDASRTILGGAVLLVLMVLGLWLSGQREPGALLISPVGYGLLMALIAAFTNLSAGLARQRDDLARLVQINASLARELDVLRVLEQVAAAGRELAATPVARVWLRDMREQGDGARPWRLAAAVPPELDSLDPSPEVRSLLEGRRDAPSATGRALLVPLVTKGTTIGVLELAGDRTSAVVDLEGRRRLQPFADAAAVAIENARLFEEAGHSATLLERNRLARELHDTIAQGLTAITMQLEAAQRSFDREPARSRARLARAGELSRATLDDVRRSVWTLAEPLHDERSMPDTLRTVATELAARSGLQVRYRHDGPVPPLAFGTATQVVRIVQEALHNVEKHAQAAHVDVLSESSDGGLRVTIEDDGVGFDPMTLTDRPGGGAGFGLISLRERARLAGGSITVDSRPGSGTHVSLTIPAPGVNAADDLSKG